MPKVSVIVPIYKVEKYLKAGIESVLSQTYKDYEIILVDDGSPDSCGKMCDEYAEKYDNIRVVHKENGGLSSARNAGLDVARGDYIYFFDPDDLISPFLLERCVNRIEKDGTDVVRFGFVVNNDAISQESLKVSFANEIANIDNGEKKLEFIEKRIFHDVRWVVWSNFFRHDIIKQHNLRFADNKKIFAEDMYFTCLFVSYSQSVSLLGEILYEYLVRNDSIMGKVGNQLKLNEMNCLSRTLYNFIEEEYLRDHYEVIHHLIVMNQINRLPKVKKLRDVFQYNKYIDSLDDKNHFRKYLKRYHLRHRKHNLKSKSAFFALYDNMIDYYLYSKNKFVFAFKFIAWKLLYLPFIIKSAIKNKKQIKQG